MQILMGGGLDEILIILVYTHCHNIMKIILVSYFFTGKFHEQLNNFSDGCLGSSNDEGRSEVR